jgi:hypothetical protein
MVTQVIQSVATLCLPFMSKPPMGSLLVVLQSLVFQEPYEQSPVIILSKPLVPSDYS